MMTCYELRPYQEELVKGIQIAWRSGHRKPCIVLPCGGGKSVILAEIARRTTAKGGRVLFLVHRQELCDQIENTFRNGGVDMSLCKIAMVQTVTRHLEDELPPKLIMTDECQHSPSNTYKRIYERFPNSYMIGATATPLRLDGTGMGTVYDELIVGVTVKELIAMNCLSPFRYYAPDTVDMSSVRKVRGDYSQSDTEAVLNKPKIYGDVIEHYRHLADGRKAIAYCPTIAYSEMLAERFSEAKIPAAHLDGNTPKDKRAKIISAFRKGVIKILCNVDLISEGFDVPDCSCAILLRPTTSLVLYTQQSMRCMRYQPDKTAIIIDHVGNVERFGLPDTDRKWLLNPPKKERGKIATAAKNAISVKQCPKCYYTYYSTEIACPNCGYTKIEVKNLFEDKKAVLKEYKEQMEKHDDELVAEYTDVSQCKTMRELYAYARKKGYKPGYAYIQGKKRGFFKK